MATAGQGPKKRILLVEDESEVRTGLKLRLEASGYEIIEAPDGVLGLETARKAQPDLIILDVMLPKMHGYQVARTLKFDEKYSQIPVIILSARSQQSDKDTGASVGADAYITKPFKAEHLLKTMETLLAGTA